MSVAYAQRARKILCIGRNYVDHIKELNNVKPSSPFFFLKPSSSILLPNEGPMLAPKGVIVHYEVELALIMGKTLKNLDPAKFGKKEAIDAIDGYALAVDMTARNIQDEAKKKGLPWSIGKGFDTFLPLSHYIPKSQIPDPHNVNLHLELNGEKRQNDSTGLMIFDIPKILTTMSSIMTIQPGDLILTGTPKGVGSVRPGDKITAGLSVNGKEIEEGKIAFIVEEKPGPYEFKTKI
ncbi:hypothetical protein NADFUDRAFT_51241 [Nadsonia fulvescens var. elongata DSM 6958]|uniref:Fumarylacetoacetase-like C-terminal domain-containing protein n=1 Tax=Nadsonia fulvescens var. elongata DSM 6958 TaxID=857566 RepID=A0A1E3PL09_9ASCO|nr:hypothetical protein NADFUDRAFT_51241 [Nadsonia fulvescens var. elongata DSM 6958]